MSMIVERLRARKDIAAGLRELHTNNDDTRTFLRVAADIIEALEAERAWAGAKLDAEKIAELQADLAASEAKRREAEARESAARDAHLSIVREKDAALRRAEADRDAAVARANSNADHARLANLNRDSSARALAEAVAEIERLRAVLKGRGVL